MTALHYTAARVAEGFVSRQVYCTFPVHFGQLWTVEQQL